MVQKIIQIGNSTGIIVPKSLLDELGLKPGNEVTIEKEPNNDALVIAKKGVKVSHSSITPRFIELMDKLNNKYGDALAVLAKK